MRLIDADAFKTRLVHEAWSREHVELLRARDIADETPPVDAVEVIRCKDCKHSHKCGGDMLMRSAGGGYIYCPLGADGYCSMGERKEE